MRSSFMKMLVVVFLLCMFPTYKTHAESDENSSQEYIDLTQYEKVGSTTKIQLMNNCLIFISAHADVDDANPDYDTEYIKIDSADLKFVSGDREYNVMVDDEGNYYIECDLYRKIGTDEYSVNIPTPELYNLVYKGTTLDFRTYDWWYWYEQSSGYITVSYGKRYGEGNILETVGPEFLELGKYYRMGVEVTCLCNGESYFTGVKEATCVKQGYAGVEHCSMCDATIKDHGSIPVDPNNHNYESKVYRAPSYHSEGIMQYKCTRCGDMYEEYIPKIEAPTTNDQSNNNSESSDNTTNTEQPSEEDKNTVKDTDKSNTQKTIKDAKKAKAIISKLTNKKGKKLVIKLKKKSGYKYQIKVSTSKKFKKSVKTYKTSKTSYTVKKLKKGKRYYVKIRTYKVIDGKTYYGKWSKVKSVKIKK